MTTRVALLGYGRMGRAIERLVPEFPKLVLGYIKKRTDSAIEALENADIAIDFSSPESVGEHIDAAIHYKIPLLIGVTGLNPEIHNKIQQAAKHIPICYAANTSVGIAVLTYLVQKAAVLLRDYDVEIAETHHKHKIDAPSGTALHLGQSVADARGISFEDHKIYPYTKKRQDDDIGFSVMRGGNVIGEHDVHFFGSDDIMTLSHKSLSRDLFAKGALTLASKLIEKKSGLYTVSDLLDLPS